MRTEDQRHNGGKLDQDVEGGAGGILEGITDGVTSDGVLVGGGALAELGAEAAGLDVLLGVVPCATSVGHGDGELDTRDEATGEETSAAIAAEDDTGDEGRANNEDTGHDHLPEGSLGGDQDAALVIGLHLAGDNLGELFHALLNHVVGGLTDGLHGHGGESVGHHRTVKETREDPRVEDVDDGDLGADGVGTEEGEGHKGGRADGETLTDGGGGVTGGVKGISAAANLGAELGHLGDATSVVRDGTVSIDGQAHGERTEHTEGSEGNTVHTGQDVGASDGDAEANDRDDAGKVTDGKTVDDTSGAGDLLGLGDLAHGGVRVGSVVLSDETDEETRPETRHDANAEVEAGDVIVSGVDGECRGHGVVGDGDGDGGLEDGRDHKDVLEDLLDGRNVIDGASGGCFKTKMEKI